MRVTIATRELLSAARDAARLVPNSTYKRPAFTQLLRIAAAAGSLSVQACDGDLFIEAKRPATVEEEGAILLNARAVVSLLGAVEAAEVTIRPTTNGEAGKIVIQAGRCAYCLTTADLEEFPAPPVPSAGPALSMPSAPFLALVAATAWACSLKNDPIAGVNIEAKGKEVRAVATNGFQLATAIEPLPYAVTAAMSGTLPRRAVAEALRAVRPGGVSLRIGGLYFKLTSGNWAISGRVVDGKYPDWRKVMPAEPPPPVVVSFAAFAGAVRRASAIGSLGSDRGADFVITRQAGKLAISTTGRHGSAVDQVDCPAAVAGEPVAFDLDRLAPILKALPCRDLAVSLGGRLSPAVFNDTERPGYCVLIMPINLK